MIEQQTIAIAAEYPDSDGERMADNTRQYEWIATIKGGLDALLRENANVFVAGDLLWYPVEGRPSIRRAPDVLVAFGRPKGHRGSYKQWCESDIAPQVVFEILSPANTIREMADKLHFYEIYGVEEYYCYDPDGGELVGWQRRKEKLRAIETIAGWVSPWLGVRFEIEAGELGLYAPNGKRLLSYVELAVQHDEERIRTLQERARADQEQARADQEAAQAALERERADQKAAQAALERERADQERLRAEEANDRAARLAATLRALGIDPEAV